MTNNSGIVQQTVTLQSATPGASLTLPEGTRMTEFDGRALRRISGSTPAQLPPAPSGRILLSAYEFGPEGAIFDPGITITLAFDRAGLPPGIDPADLRIGLWDGTGWQAIGGSKVNLPAGEVSAQVSHFSTYGLLAPAPPAEAAAGWDRRPWAALAGLMVMAGVVLVGLRRYRRLG